MLIIGGGSYPGYIPLKMAVKSESVHFNQATFPSQGWAIKPLKIFWPLSNFLFILFAFVSCSEGSLPLFVSHSLPPPASLVSSLPAPA